MFAFLRKNCCLDEIAAVEKPVCFEMTQHQHYHESLC